MHIKPVVEEELLKII